ncbi:hypothetical protein RhiirA4_480129 [Rhizophagus irregularis]|uniref:Uncharacterized protein n=1 Tax=Rhizophagus irregularis TaxID=588596 RepID=A0A2I1HHH3_9GLOM|nr:hypothetical protein RhiirA4_480129 [Rhizophagus irregularis]
MDTNFVNEEDIVYEEDLNIEPNNISPPEPKDDEIYITKSMTGWNNKEAAFTDIQYSMPKRSTSINSTGHIELAESN